jgi:hypothetical protein
MKRMFILVVLAGIVLVGCQSGSQEPPVAVTPAANEKAEPAEPDIGRGLAAWWKFDETSGKTAQDSSGNGRNGTLAGELSFNSASAEGRVGNALKLESKSDLVQVNGYKGIIGTHPRTAAAWIKTEHNDGRILAWGREDGGEMFIFGFIRDSVGVTPKGGYLYMNQRANDNKWHHVAAVVEKADLPNLHDDVKIYLDGEEAEIDDIGILDLWPIDTVSDQDVTIGKGFRGLLDDVRIYDRPLSEVEIELLFKSAE